MKTKNKHLVYAEDVIWEIMQYPHSFMSKSDIRQCATEAAEKNRITIWIHITNLIKEFFKR